MFSCGTCWEQKKSSPRLVHSYLTLDRTIPAVLAQHGQMSDQPPREAQRVFTMTGQPREAICPGLPQSQGLQQWVHVAPERLEENMLLVGLRGRFYSVAVNVCVCYLCVQCFIPVFQEVHDQNPDLFCAGAQVMIAAQHLCGPHLESTWFHIVHSSSV